MKIELKVWNGAEYLQTKEDVHLYVQAIFDSEAYDEKLMASAIADIARSNGFAEIAGETDVSQQQLERLLSRQTTPCLATFAEALRLLGLELVITPAVSLSERND